MNILVTGGAGYIGSFMVKRLLDEGYSVTVIDSLEKGHKESIDQRAQFQKGDLKDFSFLQNVFTEEAYEAVIHFAGYISVEESTKFPNKYYENNIKGSENLLLAMNSSNVNKIIFSSTAAVYGNPLHVPIPETHPNSPTNPYGESKLEVEKLLQDWNARHNVSYVSLRYFNASGAALDGSMGEDHNPETHIIPNAIKAALQAESFQLYGTDYNTKDGTAIRDYIHVIDLIGAHVLALKKLQQEKGSFIYNVGTGIGYSNKEVLQKIEEVSGRLLVIIKSPRRAGDVEELVADPTKINRELGFSPSHSDLHTIVQSAWKWHSKTKY